MTLERTGAGGIDVTTIGTLRPYTGPFPGPGPLHSLGLENDPGPESDPLAGPEYGPGLD